MVPADGAIVRITSHPELGLTAHQQEQVSPGLLGGIAYHRK